MACPLDVKLFLFVLLREASGVAFYVS
jgi:hypothetical protein